MRNSLAYILIVFFFGDKFCHSVEARSEDIFPPAYSKFIYRKLILCKVEKYVEYCL